MRKYYLLFLLGIIPFLQIEAQEKSETLQSVTGVVVDENGNPLATVNVSLSDDFKQTFTDINGAFSIDVPVGSVLYFSKNGYIAQKSGIKQEAAFRIMLISENKETVYRTGYETKNRSELTTALSVVGAEMLSRQSVSSVENALTGTMSGLTVLRSTGSEPGAELTNLYIRGIGTENLMRSPYMLVDDIESSFGQMDIHEIESITILKDGAANAIYGQRGANGTILVTTKRGFVGKPEVEFISQLGTQQPTRLPQFLNSKEYVTFYNKALQNDGLPLSSSDRYNPEMYTGLQNSLLYPDINWHDEMLRTNALQHQHKLTFRGGTEAIRYFVLLGYMNQQGLYKHTELNEGYNTNLNYNRFNIRTNLDASVNESLVVSLDLAGCVGNRNMPNASAEDIFTALSSIIPNAMPIQYADSMLAGTSQYRDNPFGMISRTGYREDRNIALQMKVKADQRLDVLTKGLSAELVLGYNGTSSFGLFKSEKYATYEMQADETYSKYGENSPLSLNMEPTNKGYLSLLTFFGGLKYNRTFDKHGVNGNVRYYQAKTRIRGDNPPYGKQGISGRGGYNFDKRYFVDFMFSYDGSDEFAKGHRFGFFPGAAAGWLVSNEQFMANNPVVTFLKLRASYGEAGNSKTSNLDRYVYQSNWSGFDSSYGGYIFGGGFAWSDGAWEGRMPNPNLTWETTKNTNMGVDLSLYDKLSVSVDGFIHNREDIILEMQNSVLSIIGSPYPYVNAGAVTNKGVETTITYRDNFDKVNFYVQGNVSFARNKIIRTDEPDNLPENLKRTGHSVTQLWGMQSAGYYADQADINNSPYNALYMVRPGDIKYENIYDDEVINDLDEIAIGLPQIPEWTGGLNAGVEWRGVDFSFLLSGFAGRSVMLSNSAVWILQNNGNATTLAYGAWETGVRENDATYPRLTTESNKNNYRNSTYWLKNGNFLRLSNVEVGYSFSGKLLGSLMKELRLYVNGQNLFSIDSLGKYNLDPEVINSGITGYPLNRTINVGLSAKF